MADIDVIRRRHAPPTSGPWDTSRGTISAYVVQARADVEVLLVECGRLREQLDAARKALQHYADQDTWDLDQLSYDESNTAGYVFWHYDGHRAEEPWAVARAALGVGDE